ncbi:hypothetical protein [Actinomadura sp. NEAU-AAG7]|uniref:hypothetical protein n=1 Tax=Actinomadura sp. NEAU-AAG7 TaxID=2839640 RepID=UPI001BE42BC7|nr:hypothetical protein [Actinomadura sp. NEAU-AAG7]MBT2210471.1 hypothetical protein [Actinomadura sp. NEAU-AAG7]
MPLSSHRSSDIPHIDAADPLPGAGERVGRWAEPYQQAETEMWVVYLRFPELLGDDVRLVDTLTATDWESLSGLMDQQNALAADARSGAGGA